MVTVSVDQDKPGAQPLTVVLTSHSVVTPTTTAVTVSPSYQTSPGVQLSPTVSVHQHLVHSTPMDVVTVSVQTRLRLGVQLPENVSLPLPVVNTLTVVETVLLSSQDSPFVPPPTNVLPSQTVVLTTTTVAVTVSAQLPDTLGVQHQSHVSRSQPVVKPLMDAESV